MYPIQTVARMPKLRRENGSSGQQRPRNSRPPSFGTLLDEAAANCPEEVYLVTYTADRQLQTYYYRPSKEYTF